MLSRLATFFRWSLVIVIVITAVLLMLNAAKTDSAVIDELAHIPSGYAYIRYQDYRLNPEHPPLVKMLSALPLLFQKLNFPLNISAWVQDVNGQWETGNQFLYGSGNDADKIIFWSRLGPILLTASLILLIYLWSRELIGRWWAILPAFLFALSPTVLAHGHYVATDIGAAFGVLTATWGFLMFLFRPSGKNLMLAGVLFGLAQLMKFSLVVLAPYFFILVLVFLAAGLWRDGGRNCRYYFKSLIFIFLIGAGVIYLFYLFSVWNYPASRQAEDTASILNTFPIRFLSDLTVWLAGIPAIRPIAHYLLGLLMVLQRSLGGNVVYFLGEVSNGGLWYYFPIAFLLKEPAASLILILSAAGFFIFNFTKSMLMALFGKFKVIKEYLATCFPEFAMILFVIFYLAYSMSGNLNIGVRHLLPAMPFVYILTASAAKNWFSVNNLNLARNFVVKILVVYNELFALSVKSVILVLLLGWYLVSVLISSPNFLSYFNVFGGGIKNGYRYIADSNYDWGQDLKRLAQYVEQVNNDNDDNNDIDRIAVDYFGGGNLEYYLGGKAEGPVVSRVEPWWSARGNPAIQGINWLAVSINTIQGAKGKLAPDFHRNPEDEYQWLKEPYKPYARAGTSIFIYKLE